MASQGIYFPQNFITKERIKWAVYQTANWSAAIVITAGLLSMGIPTIIIRQYARRTGNQFLMRYF